MADQRPKANAVNAHDNVVYCPDEVLDDLMTDLQDFNAELVGNERDGDASAHDVTVEVVALNRDNA